jgi:hypothetical protein
VAGARAGRGQTEAHVGILRISENEIGSCGLTGANPRELIVKTFEDRHGNSG